MHEIPGSQQLNEYTYLNYTKLIMRFLFKVQLTEIEHFKRFKDGYELLLLHMFRLVKPFSCVGIGLNGQHFFVAGYYLWYGDINNGKRHTYGGKVSLVIRIGSIVF